MSSRPTTPKGTPRRTLKRTPLQERSQSEKNEDASRVRREPQPDSNDVDVFTTTPFPTKPQHILLPSTIRKQRSRTNLENELPFVNRAPQAAGTQSQESLDERRPRRAPNLQLKRSVTALRDMYEAQAEKSRPSTAAQSPALRPTTSSSRLRSASSSEGMTGRSAWTLLPTVSADDLATLPTLNEATVQKINSQSSFASRMKIQAGSSSPNFRAYGSSSPKVPVFHDPSSSSDPAEPFSDPSSHSFSDPAEATSSSDAPAQSSPNVVRLGRSSSVDRIELATSPLEAIEESSPNVVRFGGTSSPRRTSSPARSDASTVLRKRKRNDDDHAPDAGRTPLFGNRIGRLSATPTRQVVPSASDASLPLTDDATMPSSPPRMGSLHAQQIESSSPVIRMPGTERRSIDSASMMSTTDLQHVLSSSPVPPIQYPVVRAPAADQFAALNMPKRYSHHTQPSTTLHDNRSSVSLPLPEDVAQLQRPGSSRSIYTEDFDDAFDEDLVTPGPIYSYESDLNGSQDLIISDADRHEATDELSALPRGARGYRPPTLVPVRSTSYLGTSSSSSQSRLNSLRTSADMRLSSMRSLAQSGHSSMRSNILRPGSAGSAVVPTWARRYYSGIYRDSFQYLYQSSTNLASSTSLALQTSSVQQRISSQSERASTSVSHSSRISLRSIRDRLTNFIPSIAIPKNQQRLDVRKSHMTAGIGPLVSNPVQPGSIVVHRASHSLESHVSTIRRVSTPLPPVDPRAHWAGIVEEEEEDEMMGDGTQPRNTSEYADSSRQPTSIYSRRPRVPLRSSLRLLRLPSPHLHHDHRLNTGSSASLGYGHPFNRKSRFLPTDAYEEDSSSRPPWFRADLRSGQVLCFMTGFIFPLMWFVGALLPLPQRPARFGDIEKAEMAARQHGVTAEEMDIVAKLRFERYVQGIEETKWQNARWWRRMNKFMCVVGFVVIVVVIVLAVIGTKSRW